MSVCHGSITKISRGRWVARLLRLNGCGSRDVGNYNCAKGKAGYPTLAFQCITDLIAGSLPSMVSKSALGMTRRL